MVGTYDIQPFFLAIKDNLLVAGNIQLDGSGVFIVLNRRVVGG
jgi:hypothetical protein